MPTDISDLCCVNSACPDKGKRAAENLGFVRWTGKNRNIRFVRCRTCDTDFSERKGTPLFDARLPEQEIVSIFEHLMEGDGQRKTGRLTHHKQETVARYQRLGGRHAKAFHDEKAKHLQVPEAQLDEKWSFVGKKTGPPDGGGTGQRPPGR
jgi:LacI family transcriptional regulator